jgi:hypothetical protein
MERRYTTFRADLLFEALGKEFPDVPKDKLARYISQAENIALIWCRMRSERQDFLRRAGHTEEEVHAIDSWGETIATAFNLGSAEISGSEDKVMPIARVVRLVAMRSPAILSNKVP